MVVEVPAEVRLGGLELCAGGVHFAKDFVKMAGLLLRVQRGSRQHQDHRGEKKRQGETAIFNHTSCAPIGWMRFVAMMLAKNPGVVCDEVVLGVVDGLVLLDRDLAGDGFDDAKDSSADLGVG